MNELDPQLNYCVAITCTFFQSGDDTLQVISCLVSVTVSPQDGNVRSNNHHGSKYSSLDCL